MISDRDVGKMILSSMLATIVNIIIGITLTRILAEIGMQSLIPWIWMLLLAGIPLEILIALRLIRNL